MNIAMSDEDGKPKQPSPDEFDAFLPWACEALQVTETIFISKILQSDYVSVIGLSSAKSKKAKGKPSKMDMTPNADKEDSFTLPKVVLSDIEPGIQIVAFYDALDNLVKLNFDRNNHVPQIIFKIIGLIIKFHYYLHTITINAGLNQGCVYEISKFLPYSRITDLCLDSSFISEANFHLLLEQDNMLRHLSLARCSINDAVVENIAATLIYPFPASKTLSILNLSSNKITDLGAEYLSEMLRSNRQLSYLNLSGNMLTDIGANKILSSLCKFPLTLSELLAARSRQMTYLKEKNELVARMVKELRAGDFEKRTAKRKSTAASKATPAPKKKGLERELSAKSVPESKSIANLEAFFNERAMNMAESALGEFSDPFLKANTELNDGFVCSLGNNSLAYLSLAYNNLSYVTVKKILQVLTHQKEMGRQPRGLINISIEGNMMPVTCKEMLAIDDLIEIGLMMGNRRYSLPKKRTQPKTASSGR